jgi:hypothetical protein
MLLTMVPVVLDGRRQMAIMGLSRVEFMKEPEESPCSGKDVFCNIWSLDPNLAEGADGKYRAYHLSPGMHPHEEYWNWAEEDPVGALVTSIGNGVY